MCLSRLTVMSYVVFAGALRYVGYGAGRDVRVTLCGLRCAGTVCVCVCVCVCRDGEELRRGSHYVAGGVTVTITISSKVAYKTTHANTSTSKNTKACTSMSTQSSGNTMQLPCVMMRYGGMLRCVTLRYGGALRCVTTVRYGV